LDDSCCDHDGRAQGDGEAAAHPITDICSWDEGWQTTQADTSYDQAKDTCADVSDVVMP
jgi:hypothetical protein